MVLAGLLRSDENMKIFFAVVIENFNENIIMEKTIIGILFLTVFANLINGHTLAYAGHAHEGHAHEGHAHTGHAHAGPAHAGKLGSQVSKKGIQKNEIFDQKSTLTRRKSLHFLIFFACL